MEPTEQESQSGSVVQGAVDFSLDLGDSIGDSQEPKIENDPKVEEKPVDKPADDPEFDMDWEDEPGKGKAKAKLSELRETAKWLRENKQMVAGTLKIREEAQKNPNFGKALQTLINRSYDEKGTYNGTYVDKVLAQLEAREDVIEDKIDDKTDDILEMERMLKELDEESPHAQILKRNINAAKGMRQQLKDALDQNKKFQERLDGVEKFQKDVVTEKETAAKTEQVKRLSSVYDKEIGALTDTAKSDGYKFVDADEKADFDRAVRDAIASKSNAIKTDEEFVKAIKDTAKDVYEKMSKRREAYINDYLKVKKGTGAPKDAPKVEPKKEKLSFGEALNNIDFTATPDS